MGDYLVPDIQNKCLGLVPERPFLYLISGTSDRESAVFHKRREEPFIQTEAVVEADTEMLHSADQTSTSRRQQGDPD